MSEEASADVGPSRTSRELGRGAALFVSVGAVIGSGWLFAGFDASELSGGGSILAWVIAGALGAVLAMSYAELGSTFPVDGGVGRFPLYAFGRPTGFLSGFLSWITAVCIAPIETVASLRYASNYLPWFSQDSHGLVELSAAGRLVAAGVLLVFILVNTAGVRLFSETNSAVVWFKIAVPVIVAATLLAVHFHSGNFTEHGGPFFGGRARDHAGDLPRRSGLRPPRLRTGHPARRRDPQSPVQHSFRRARLGRDRDGHLPLAPDRVHRRPT